MKRLAKESKSFSFDIKAYKKTIEYKIIM